MKVNKIQLDRIKQGCQCTFFEGHLGEKYVAEQCKFCKINKVTVIKQLHHIESIHWVDEVNTIDPNILANFSNREQNYHIYGLGKIEPPTDFNDMKSIDFWQQKVNEGKLKLINKKPESN